MRKIISLVCAAILLVSMGIPAFAVENYGKLQKFLDIPIYVTTFDPNNSLTQAEKDNISDKISAHRSDSKASLNTTDKYTIAKLTDSQIKAIVNSPLYASTLNRVEELIDSGTAVKSINFYVPYSTDFITQSSAQTRSGNADDIAYWEANLPVFGTYQGYNFLYSETSANVETTEVPFGNTWNGIKWDVIAQKYLWILCDHLVQNQYYQAVRTIYSALSPLFSGEYSPLSISYGPSTGYINGSVSGDIYIRTIFIRDDLDRITGYAYYPWASAERFAAALRLKAKYPYQLNPGGTYEYAYSSYTTTTQNTYTAGYRGNNSNFYQRIIELYNATGAYVTYSESIDVRSAIASVLG